MSLRNLTPSSTGLASPASMIAGVAAAFHRLEHGQLPLLTVTVIPGPAISMLPLSSIARLRIVDGPGPPGSQLYVQLEPPCAACHVAPPSVETSTAATSPFVSVAVPAMVNTVPEPIGDPPVGDVM